MAYCDTDRVFKNKANYLHLAIAVQGERPLKNAEGSHPMTAKQDKSKNTREDNF